MVIAGCEGGLACRGMKGVKESDRVWFVSVGMSISRKGDIAAGWRGVGNIGDGEGGRAASGGKGGQGRRAGQAGRPGGRRRRVTDRSLFWRTVATCCVSRL